MSTEPKKLSVESWDIDRLKPYANNAKKHSQEQIQKLANNIRSFGWDQPIVVDGDGVIIKGHGRFLAAKHLGFKKVPVVVRKDLTPEQVKAARLSDNRVASTDYDTRAMQTELAELARMEVPMVDLGFDARELEFMTADAGKIDLDGMVEDVGKAADESASTAAAASDNAATEEVAIAKAFGIKTVPAEAQRDIGRFVSSIEEETGKKGSEALVLFIRGVIGEA